MRKANTFEWLCPNTILLVLPLGIALNIFNDRFGYIAPRNFLYPKAWACIDLKHQWPTARAHKVNTRHRQAHRLSCPQTHATLGIRQADRRPFASLMEVRSKIVI